MNNSNITDSIDVYPSVRVNQWVFIFIYLYLFRRRYLDETTCALYVGNTGIYSYKLHKPAIWSWYFLTHAHTKQKHFDIERFWFIFVSTQTGTSSDLNLWLTLWTYICLSFHTLLRFVWYKCSAPENEPISAANLFSLSFLYVHKVGLINSECSSLRLLIVLQISAA